MIVIFQPAVIERLQETERREGIPPTEMVHQAVEVWSHLQSNDERQTIGLAIMQLVARRART